MIIYQHLEKDMKNLQYGNLGDPIVSLGIFPSHLMIEKKNFIMELPQT